MPSTPIECTQTTTGTLAPTCSLELTSDVIPSVQYQCNGNGIPVLSSVMVHATDPESGIRAPFKLEPGKGCHDICDYSVGGSGFQVRDIQFTGTTIKVGGSELTPDPFMCKPEGT